MQRGFFPPGFRSHGESAPRGPGQRLCASDRSGPGGAIDYGMAAAVAMADARRTLGQRDLFRNGDTSSRPHSEALAPSASSQLHAQALPPSAAVVAAAARAEIEAKISALSRFTDQARLSNLRSSQLDAEDLARTTALWRPESPAPPSHLRPEAAPPAAATAPAADEAEIPDWPRRPTKACRGITPTCFDVLMGRGKRIQNHSGNVNYRNLVLMNKPLYAKCKYFDKAKVANAIVAAIRQHGGRFLDLDKEAGAYYDIGDKKAREKTGQALREGQRSFQQKTSVPESLNDNAEDEDSPPPNSPPDRAVVSPCPTLASAPSAADEGGATRRPRQGKRERRQSREAGSLTAGKCPRREDIALDALMMIGKCPSGDAAAAKGSDPQGDDEGPAPKRARGKKGKNVTFSEKSYMYVYSGQRPRHYSGLDCSMFDLDARKTARKIRDSMAASQEKPGAGQEGPGWYAEAWLALPDLVQRGCEGSGLDPAEAVGIEHLLLEGRAEDFGASVKGRYARALFEEQYRQHMKNGRVDPRLLADAVTPLSEVPSSVATFKARSFHAESKEKS